MLVVDWAKPHQPTNLLCFKLVRKTWRPLFGTYAQNINCDVLIGLSCWGDWHPVYLFVARSFSKPVLDVEWTTWPRTTTRARSATWWTFCTSCTRASTARSGWRKWPAPPTAIRKPWPSCRICCLGWRPPITSSGTPGTPPGCADQGRPLTRTVCCIPIPPPSPR